MPMSRLMVHHSRTLPNVSCIWVTVMQLVMQMMPPTDKSKPPVSRTKVWPMATRTSVNAESHLLAK